MAEKDYFITLQEQFNKFRFNPMPEGYYDWRKGREWVRNQDGTDLSYIGLSITKEEKIWWQEAKRQIAEKRAELSLKDLARKNSGAIQSLAYLLHPQLGRLYSFDALKRVEIMIKERCSDNGERILLPDEKYFKIREERDSGREQHKIVNDIANMILNDDIKVIDKLASEDVYYLSDVWHCMIQFSQIERLPYLELIPEDEAKMAISWFNEERLAFFKELDRKAKKHKGEDKNDKR